MKSVLSFAFAGVAVAQNGYGNPPPPAYYGGSSSSSSSSTPVAPHYGDSTSSSSSSTPAPPHYGDSTTTSAGSYPTPSCPAPGSTDNKGRYSCNPAHQYPEGQTCELIDGCYFIEYPKTTYSASSSSATYACNPAHDYGNGASCISTYGTLTLVYPSNTKTAGYPATTSTSTSAGSYPTPSCPAPGSTDNKGRYSCNPAHQYPEGQTCELIDGCYFIEYPKTTYSATGPAGYPTKSSSSSSSSSATYACNPAHEYPEGAECVSTGTTLSLIYPSVTKPGSYPTPSKPAYTTEVVTQYTTYCPQPTTLTHEHKTYTITSATTITLPCSKGCTVTKPVYSVPTYAPSVTKPVYPTLSHSKIWYNTTVVESKPPTYTTKTVTSLTTYCPEPTTLTYGPSTYTVTKATTLTIGCPGGCTVTETKPAVHTTKVVTYAPPPPKPTTEEKPSTYAPPKPSSEVPPPKPSTYAPPKPSSEVPPPKPTTYVQQPPKETHPVAPSSEVPPPKPTTYAPPPYPTHETSSVVSVTRPSATLPGTTTSSIVQYTGAAAPMKTGAPIVAAIAMGAFFL